MASIHREQSVNSRNGGIVTAIEVRRAPVARIEQLADFEGEYVYDIGVDDDTPYFFANDILVHNSCYFSATKVLTNPDFAQFEWSRENIIAFYDIIAEETNKTFAGFMQRTFNTSAERGAIIKAGRELVASKGLFIKKKKYAVLIYDQEGKRLDTDGKSGKLKAMGLDLKRSDTPRFMQQFLEQLLIDLLSGQSKAEMYDRIKEFRTAFKTRPGWEKGAPKKVRNVGMFTAKEQKAGKLNMPGHVRASLNWNRLCELHGDRHATRITDSARIIVCKLRANNYGMTSIAYPIDETHLPTWFQELPFDHEAMESSIIDAKLTNLVGVLDWDLSDTMAKMGEDVFSFG